MSDVALDPWQSVPFDSRRWVGTIKFFDCRRRWGFIVSDADQHADMPSKGREIFLPWISLLESGIDESSVRRPGGRVSFLVCAPDGPGRNWKAVGLQLLQAKVPLVVVSKRRF